MADKQQEMTHDHYLAMVLIASTQLDTGATRSSIMTGFNQSQAININDLPQVLANANIEAAAQQLDPKQMALPALIFNQQRMFLAIARDKHTLTLVDDNNQQQQQTFAELKQYEPQSWHIVRANNLDQRGTTNHSNHQRHWLLAAFDQVKPFYGSFLAASLAINVLALITPLFTMNVYDRVVPNQAIDTLWVLAIGACIAISFDWLLKQARSKLADVAGKQIDTQVSAKLFQHVLGMQLEHRPVSAGAFAKQLQDFDSVREFITSATLVTAVDLPFTIIFLVLIAMLGGPMVLVPLTCMLLLLIVSYFMQKRLMSTIEHTGKYSTQRQAHLIETLNLLIETKQNNGQHKAQLIWNDICQQLADWQNESRSASNTLTYSVMGSQQLVTIGLIVTGVYQIAAGNLSMGGLIAIVMLSGRAASAINQIAMLILKFKQTQQAMVSVEAIFELPQEQQQQSLNASKISFDGSVLLRQADFSYPDAQIAALQTIDLDIKAGERIGLAGPAGAGKSTLLAILAGQYQLTQGQLFYHQLQSNQWSITKLRQHIGWMGQQPQLIYGSVLDNLLFGLADVDEQALAQVIVGSGLDQLLERLGSGLNSPVGEFGRQLSGGQRQVIALARTLLRQPKLLLLDEPTSAMDPATEAKILHYLSRQTNITMVIASHNPQVLALCDRILVLEQGQIIQQQPRAEYQQSTRRRIKAVNVTTKQGVNS